MKVDLGRNLRQASKLNFGDIKMNVKEFKQANIKTIEASIGSPIYHSKPFVIMGSVDVTGKSKIVLDAGDIDDIKNALIYHDDCDVEVRKYDLYGSDNTRI
jgi:hypothetical protein